MAGPVVKFLVKSAVAGSLVYAAIRITHGPWRPPHMARFTEEKDFMAAYTSSNQEVQYQMHSTG